MKRTGYTLVEVVIAVLIIGVMTAPMVTIGLSGRMNMGRTDRRLAAAAAVRQVSEALKAYVTADRSLAPGPGVGPNGWTLPGDDSGLPAFEPGRHPLDVSRWAPALAAHGGRMHYDVVLRATPAGPQPDVTFTVEWDE